MRTRKYHVVEHESNNTRVTNYMGWGTFARGSGTLVYINNYLGIWSQRDNLVPSQNEIFPILIGNLDIHQHYLISSDITHGYFRIHRLLYPFLSCNPFHQQVIYIFHTIYSTLNCLYGTINNLNLNSYEPAIIIWPKKVYQLKHINIGLTRLPWDTNTNKTYS